MLARRPARGFSMLELLIVVGIALVIAVVAIPTVLTTVENFKLRSAASGLSGLMQKTRMLAVARNAACPTGVTCSTSGYYAVKTVTPTSGVTYVFIDIDGSGSIDQTLERSNVMVPSNISLDNTDHPDDTAIQNGLEPKYVLPNFTARGLPCFVSTGCQINSAWINITYLRQDRPFGATGWAAVTVTPAGRVQVWTWDGTAWEGNK